MMGVAPCGRPGSVSTGMPGLDIVEPGRILAGALEVSTGMPGLDIVEPGRILAGALEVSRPSAVLLIHSTFS